MRAPTSNYNHYTGKEAIGIALIRLWQKTPSRFGYSVKQIINEIRTFQFVQITTINTLIQTMKASNEVKETGYVNKRAVLYRSVLSPELINDIEIKVRKVTRAECQRKADKLISSYFSK